MSHAKKSNGSSSRSKPKKQNSPWMKIAPRVYHYSRPFDPRVHALEVRTERVAVVDARTHFDVCPSAPADACFITIDGPSWQMRVSDGIGMGWEVSITEKSA